MVGIKMYAGTQKLKKLGYKKQRVARQMEIDTKTVRKYWDMPEDEYITQQYEGKERTKNMDPYREYVLDKLREEFGDFGPSYRSARRKACRRR